jgi:hypothetical protein
MGWDLHSRWFWLQFPLFALVYQLQEWIVLDFVSGVVGVLVVDVLAVPLAYLALRLDISATRTALFSVGTLVLTVLLDYLYMIVTTEVVSAVAAVVVWILSVVLCYLLVLHEQFSAGDGASVVG